jgi:PAS domain S-box-containing protein
MGLSMTAVLCYIIFAQQHKYQNALFDREVLKIHTSIKEQLNTYDMLSESLSNFVRFQRRLSSEQWQTYTRDLIDQNDHFNSIDFKYLRIFPNEHPSSLTHHKAESVLISPSAQRCIVEYSTYMHYKGLNLCSDPLFQIDLLNSNLHKFMSLDLGTHKNQKIAKDQIHFFREASEDKGHSQQALSNNKDAWTIVSVPIKKIFDGVASKEFLLKVYLDGPIQSLLYASSPQLENTLLERSISVQIGDTSILFKVYALDSSPLFSTSRIIYFGVAISILLTLLIAHLAWSLTVSRRKAESLTENIQQDLYMTRLRHRSIIENIPGAVYRAVERDDVWIVEYMSEYIYEMTGFPSTKYVGKNRLSHLLLDDADAELIKEAYNRPVENGAYKIEYKVRHADGSTRWFAEHGYRVMHKETQKFVAAVVFDVTELKEKNERMNTLNTALQNAVEGISILTTEWRYIELNQAFLDMFDICPANQMKETIYNRIHPDDHSALRDEFSKHHGKRFSIVVRGLGRKKSIFHAHFVFVPILLNDQTFAGYYCFARDISPLLERERALADALETIKTAYHSKSEFLATVSHELRTPLNAIIGYSDLILEDNPELSQTVASDISKIRQAGSHLLKLINDILDASKLEAGKIELHYETFDLFAFSDSLMALLAPTARKRQNSLVLECDQEIGMICSDYTRLRQCLMNLLSNACKFTQNGTITLKIKQLLQGEAAYIIFDVIDTGCGIDAAALKKIFHPFTQEDSSTTRRYGGTGLGLTITKQFTELLGGSIDVNTIYGKGSTFTLSIPHHQSHHEHETTEIPQDLKNAM